MTHQTELEVVGVKVSQPVAECGATHAAAKHCDSKLAPQQSLAAQDKTQTGGTPLAVEPPANTVVTSMVTAIVVNA